MKSAKVERFMVLAGQEVAERFSHGDPELRKLGAQLLLSEVLEYVISGLGVVPQVGGVEISDPDSVTYSARGKPDQREMLDGLADVAYTMFWNSSAFGVRLEEGYDLVCDNNLEKFVRLPEWEKGERELDQSEWGLGRGVRWPTEVVTVQTVRVDGEFYAVGKDRSGKVRKPSTYTPVDLIPLLSEE